MSIIKDVINLWKAEDLLSQAWNRSYEMMELSREIFTQAIKYLRRGENIEIRGFGTYKIVKRKARTGRNPKNSELVQIPEKNAVRWKMSKTFFNRLNKSFTDDKISDTY